MENTNQSYKPYPTSHYTKKLRQYIPQEATKPATYKLLPMFGHVLFIFLNMWLIQRYSSLPILVGCSTLTGISIACLFLYSHELSHGTIVREQPYLYLLQNFFWAFSGIPPTVWKKVHNLSHHQHMNTYDDPDRKTFKSEANFFSKLYNLFIYPNKKLRYSLTVGFAMIFYSTKHILAVFYKKDSKLKIVTYRPHYTPKEVRTIAFELLYILAFWGIIWWTLSFPEALIFSFISWFIYSAFVITFIITQHLRDPVFVDVADPLLTTTSVIIPTWLDKIADWHSFHVEHHLFPGINFDYYPQLSEKISEEFPHLYDRIPILEAIRESYDKEVLIDDPLV